MGKTRVISKGYRHGTRDKQLAEESCRAQELFLSDCFNSRRPGKCCCKIKQLAVKCTVKFADGCPIPPRHAEVRLT